MRSVSTTASTAAATTRPANPANPGDPADDEVRRILEGAYRLIRRDGVIEPRMRDLLAEVGLANRSFYRRFPAKDDFLMVMVEDLQGRLTRLLTALLAEADNPRARVVAWIRGVLSQAVDHDSATLGRPFLIQGARLREAYPSVYRATGEAMLELLTDAITAAVDGGQLHSPDTRADARAIFHLTMAVMQSHVLDRTQPTDAEQSAVIDFALRALR